jgi:UDP-N-acetylmuramoylalanine--D-glutamate ligase
MHIQGTSWGVWGFGVVGQSVARFLHERGAVVNIYDHKPIEAQRALGYTIYQPDQLASFLAEQALIVPSPGVDIRMHYATHGSKIISEVDLFYAFFKKPIIAITGSVGKTTITRLLSLILEKLGHRLLTGGNVGLGMCDLIALQSTCDYAVLELSSFQLEYAQQFKSHLSIITPLHPNHLDRHETMDQYINAKLTIIAQHTSDGLAILPHSVKNYASRYPGTTLWYEETPTNPRAFTLPPVTFPQNWDIILKSLTLLDVDWNRFESIAPSITLTQEHRLEYVTTRNGVAYYNDSKSTTAASTLAAVDYFAGKAVHLILGGLSKGVNRKNLIESLQNKIAHVYCFGQEAEQLHGWCQEYTLTSSSHPTLEECIQIVNKQIRTNDIVLFSPGGSSYDLFKEYQERGNQFKTLVTTLPSL